MNTKALVGYACAFLVGCVLASVSAFGTVTLLERFEWRAAPLLAVLMIAAVCGIAALLGRLRELQNRS